MKESSIGHGLSLNTIYNMDCIEGMKLIPDNSIDSIVTDPPYEIGFMGKGWDSTGIANNVDMWKECLRVLKPGGHLLSFGGTRTYHRMAVAIEDAGFEVRDMIEWVYGSGFPKSLNVGKSINSIETKEWSNIGKAIDIVSEKNILQVWKNNSNNVSIVETQSLKNQIIAGQDMPRDITVQANVAEENNQENGNLIVDFVVKNLQEVQALLPETNTALMNVDAEIRQKQDLAKCVEQSLQNLNHKYLDTSIAEGNANELQKEKTSEIIKVEEALMTLRGNKKYGNNEVINALCVALTENLKLIILNQSNTFQSLDTKLQMECASAINVTITESTAECLISNMVDIAKKIAVDKLQGNEREVVGQSRNGANSLMGGLSGTETTTIQDVTKGTSEWEGWGTALKPAHEPICMARKPLAEKTVAENVLKYGTGGINIDESRVGTEDNLNGGAYSNNREISTNKVYGEYKRIEEDYQQPLGRFPANLIHDNSEEVRECFPESKGGAFPKTHGSSGFVSPEEKESRIEMNDSGNASRFFKSIIYQAKASKSERKLEDGNYSTHPTVKPIALMEYLIKMVTKEGGIVFDPFTGSGTTLVAAKKNGYQYIGCELTEEYIPIIEARLQAEKQYPDNSLFS